MTVMKRLAQFLLLIFTFMSVVALVLRYGSEPVANFLGIRERAGIRIESNPLATVLINNQEVGKTPYDSDQLEIGEQLIELKAVDEQNPNQVFAWKGNVVLNPGTVTVVNRDLSVIDATASGEIISLEPGKGAIIISTPSEAEVTIDGKDVGRTPLRIDELAAGDHVFIIGRPNYLKRSIKASLVEGFRLNLMVDLALSEADLTSINTEPVNVTQQVVIKATPTGFLRVRSEATVNSTEIGRLNPGTTVVLLEELPSWYRIRLSDGKEGYISTSYADKKTN